MKKGDLVRVREISSEMQGFVGLVLGEERELQDAKGIKFHDVLFSDQICCFPDFWLEVIDEEG